MISKLCAAVVSAGLWIMGGSSPVFAQILRVYSEFQRVDPFGEVVSFDRPRRPDVRPREILSPAVARNAFSSYHVAVTVPSGQAFTLHVGQNPEGYFRLTLYKEIYVKLGETWIPDGLEPIQLPYTVRLPDLSQRIPGQTTVSFWMDAQVPYDAEVGRVKLDPMVYSDGHWIVYPMEVRVTPALVPEPQAPVTFLGAVQEPADASVRGFLRGYLCGDKQGDPGRRPSVRLFILRNALQDAAFARSLGTARGADVLPGLLRRLARVPDGKAWCDAPAFPSDLGPEWYLKVRDVLYRMVN